MPDLTGVLTQDFGPNYLITFALDALPVGHRLIRAPHSAPVLAGQDYQTTTQLPTGRDTSAVRMVATTAARLSRFWATPRASDAATIGAYFTAAYVPLSNLVTGETMCYPLNTCFTISLSSAPADAAVLALYQPCTHLIHGKLSNANYVVSNADAFRLKEVHPSADPTAIDVAIGAGNPARALINGETTYYARPTGGPLQGLPITSYTPLDGNIYVANGKKYFVPFYGWGIVQDYDFVEFGIMYGHYLLNTLPTTVYLGGASGYPAAVTVRVYAWDGTILSSSAPTNITFGPSNYLAHSVTIPAYVRGAVWWSVEVSGGDGSGVYVWLDPTAPIPLLIPGHAVGWPSYAPGWALRIA